MMAMAFSQARRVLVVDDDEAVLEMTLALVTDLGYAADKAMSGAEALRLFDATPYDVVLTDLRMPGMSGWEVLDAVRRRRPDTPVILLTGFIASEDDPRLRQRRVGLLRKPVDAATLHAAIMRLLVEGL